MRAWAFALFIMLTLTAFASRSARADDRAPWQDVEEEEQGVLKSMLTSPDWPFRAMALARLDRYQGEVIATMVRAALVDSAWQVRCFALRQAQLMQIEIAPEVFLKETDARVLRTALRCGFAVPAEHVDPIATKLLATKNIDDLMLGIELAAVIPTEGVREDASSRLTRLVAKMNDAIAALVAGRLMAVLDLPRLPETSDDFRRLLHERGGTLTLPTILPGQRPVGLTARSTLAQMDPHVFARLRDYLGVLRQRDLDLVLVMDATSSMLPMVNEARAGVDALILFMSELSRTMRLAFIAYRDNDNKPVWEGERFTDNINTIREFLFQLRITGGADLPEAVCDGVCACRELNWRKDARRMIVLIGDAPPHAEDESKLFRELDWHAHNGNVVHTVHVPMAFPRGYLESLPMRNASEQQLQREQYNIATRQKFERIATRTNGKSDSLKNARNLVPVIMHFTIEQQWHEAFDEFYRLYVELCR